LEDTVKLYLSSYQFGDRFDDLLAAVGAGGKAAIISNAADLIPMDARLAYARTVFDPVAQFRDHGVDAAELDLRAYFGAPEALNAALADVRLVWANGGNAFLLRRAMRQSGLDDLLRRRLAHDALVYGGWSAGAVVAGTTLRGIELMDDPDVVVDGYSPATAWDGLGLVNFAIVPHFESDSPDAGAAAGAQAYMQAIGIPHRTMRDGDVIMVDRL
jgi:dipeptidase E